ncbi:MAG: hypothetical protein ABI181_04360, partial [Mycobacteriaceae bacterium]
MAEKTLARWGERVGAAVGAVTLTLQRVGEQARARGREAAALTDLDDLRREVAELVAPPRHRRWPWVVLGVATVAAAGVTWAWRRPVG